MTRLTILAMAVLVAASGAASATVARYVPASVPMPQMQIRPVVWCGLVPMLLRRCR